MNFLKQYIKNLTFTKTVIIFLVLISVFILINLLFLKPSEYDAKKQEALNTIRSGNDYVVPVGTTSSDLSKLKSDIANTGLDQSKVIANGSLVREQMIEQGFTTNLLEQITQTKQNLTSIMPYTSAEYDITYDHVLGLFDVTIKTSDQGIETKVRKFVSEYEGGSDAELNFIR